MHPPLLACQKPHQLAMSRRILPILKALAKTETEDRLIASAAIIGESQTPVIGWSTPAAIGMPRALWPKSNAKFCLMLATVALVNRWYQRSCRRLGQLRYAAQTRDRELHNSV